MQLRAECIPSCSAQWRLYFISFCRVTPQLHLQECKLKWILNGSDVHSIRLVFSGNATTTQCSYFPILRKARESKTSVDDSRQQLDSISFTSTKQNLSAAVSQIGWPNIELKYLPELKYYLSALLKISSRHWSHTSISLYTSILVTP